MVASASERSARYRAKDVEAYRAKKAAYARTPEQREKRRLYLIQWREKNRDQYNAKKAAEHRKRYRERTKESRHDEHLRRTYGINREQWLEMLASQNGKCMICDSDTQRGSKSWHVDHCHATGKVRGLLCNMCNPRLGWYETYAKKIVEYLEKTREVER